MSEPSPRPPREGARQSPEHLERSFRNGPLRPDSGLSQYHELLIPLQLNSRLAPLERRSRFDRLVGEALRRAAPDGWEPDEPTAWEPLRGARRFVVRDRRGLFTSTRTWESVTIRLRRPAPGPGPWGQRGSGPVATPT